MDVSVVIVNWNACDVLADCLRSIREQTPSIACEVIVIDNASTDGSVEMVRRDFPDVHLIANEDNLGFAAANNQGMRAAQGRYVLLLNPDTVILDRAIEKNVAFADARSDAGVVGVKTLRGDRRLTRNCFQYSGLLNLAIATSGLNKAFPTHRFWSRERYGWWDYNSIRTVDVVAGCYMLVRKEVIDSVGGMDEQFFMYGEEMDWCRRITRAGWKIYFQPDACIIHYGGLSAAQNPNSMQMEQRKSYLYYFRKHYGRLSVLLARSILLGGGTFRLAYWSGRWFVSRGDSRRRAADKIRKARILYFGWAGGRSGYGRTSVG